MQGSFRGEFACFISYEKPLEEINKRRKETYKINRNVGAGTIRKNFKDLFLSTIELLSVNLKKVQDVILMSLEKVKETTKDRLRKMLRANDRHQTELNYKRDF